MRCYQPKNTSRDQSQHMESTVSGSLSEVQAGRPSDTEDKKVQAWRPIRCDRINKEPSPLRLMTQGSEFKTMKTRKKQGIASFWTVHTRSCMSCDNKQKEGLALGSCTQESEFMTVKRRHDTL